MPVGASPLPALGLDEREREYSPSSRIGGDWRPYLAAYVQRSRAAVERLGAPRTLAYGRSASETVDVFAPPAGSPAATLVYFHGGYWQELSKHESAFAAGDALDAGAAFVAVDYTLAPAVRVETIVAQCVAAFDRVHAEAAGLGLDPARLVVAGSSAGAHLAAMVALQRPRAVAAAVLVSGVYDLGPLVGTSINAALGLEADDARALSPQFADLSGFPPAVLAWGDNETGEFVRQSGAFAAALRACGRDVEVFEVPGRNHFDVILELASPGTSLGEATLARLRSGGASPRGAGRALP